MPRQTVINNFILFLLGHNFFWVRRP